MCYAYTNDASRLSEESFHNSAWFTRSWVLQELLAPDDLRFYDASFESMGAKNEMITTLESITNVPEIILRDPEKMYERPIAQRMSWAAT